MGDWIVRVPGLAGARLCTLTKRVKTKCKSFAVGTSEKISSAVLIRPSAVTHSSDSDQRSVDLAVSNATAAGATLTVPSNHNLTPPGWYMLFVRNASGAPSVAKWVKVA